jgi:hypothetical protein
MTLREMLSAWSQLLAVDHDEAPLSADRMDIVSAVLLTLGTLALAIGVAALLGGSHG